MKRLRSVTIIMAVVFLVAGIAAAAQQEASVEKGKALFNDPKLGTTGKSCNDCHRNGSGMEKAAGRTDIVSIVNGCIQASIKGTPLDAKSAEMQSLVLYIKSFGAPKKPETRQAPMGY